MYLSANITTKTTKDVCKLPRRAIFSDNKVFIVNANNELEIKDLTIVSKQGNIVLVSNVKENTIIVSEPLIDTKEGTLINPIIK